MKNNSRIEVILLVIAACTAMSFVEAVLQPVYMYKSIIKAAVFLGCIGIFCLREKRLTFFGCFVLKEKRTLIRSLTLGAAVYLAILGSYLMAVNFIDLQTISQNLLSKEGISKENFIYVSVYISVVNSFLEEVFFRGFAYLTLRRFASERFSFIFSALMFALYHIFIMSGWFSPVLFLLILSSLVAAGALFNYADRKDCLCPSWVIHMSANLAINTVGFIMFGIL